VNPPNSTRSPFLSVVLSAGAIFFSAVIGSVTTVVHQSSTSVLGIDVPWGLVLAVAIVLAWFVGLLLLETNRWVLIACGVACLGLMFTLSQRGPGGSVLVPDSWIGNVWVMITPLVVIVLMFWPRIPRKVK
jgi:hypothetical protein